MACPKIEQSENIAQGKVKEAVEMTREEVAEEAVQVEVADEEKAVERPWDRYEAALLLEAYLQIKEQPEEETSILLQLAEVLKKRAMELKKPLDVHFLSIEGLQQQKEWMASCFLGRRKGLEGPIPKSFREVSGIYKKDVSWYQLILRHAQREAGTAITPIQKKKTTITVIDGTRIDRKPNASSPSIEVNHHDTVKVVVGGIESKEKESDNRALVPLEENKPPVSNPMQIDNNGADKAEETDGTTGYQREKRTDTVKESAESYRSSTGNQASSSIETAKEKQEQMTNQRIAEFDLTRDRDYSRYIPCGFFYSTKGVRNTEDYISVKDWEDFYITCLKYLFKNHLQAFQVLRSFSVYSDDKYIVAPAYQDALRKPFILADGYCIELDLMPNEMMRHIKQILFKCHILLSDFTFAFVKKEETKEQECESTEPVPGKMEPTESVSELPIKPTETEENKDNLLSGSTTCDLSVPRNFNAAQPLAFSYFEEKENISDWVGLYTRCCRILYDDYPKVFKEVASNPSLFKDKVYLSDNFSLHRLKHPTWLAKGIYLELDVKPNEMMDFLRQMLVKCQVDFENLVFYFSELPEEIKATHSIPSDTTAQVKPETHPDIDTPCEADVAETNENDSSEDGEAVTFAKQVMEVLKEEFPDGMRQNGIHAKRFKARFIEKFGRTLDAGNQELLDEIKSIGSLRSDGRIYAKEEGIQQDILDTIAKNIDTLLSGDATAVYWECLFEKYNKELAEQSIFDIDLMKGELLKRLRGKSYRYIREGAISVWGKPAVHGQELITALQESPYPVSVETMHETFWYWPIAEIKKVLRNEENVVNTGGGSYFYMPNIPLSVEEKKVLHQALLTEVSQNEFITGKELHELLETHCPSFLQDAQFLNDAALRKVMGYLFPITIDVNGAVLVEKGSTMTMNEIFHTFCQRYKELSSSQIRKFAQQIGKTGNYWNDVMEDMVRVSPSQWMRRDQVYFPKRGEMAKVLSECLGKRKVIPLSDITLFFGFPPMNVKWNLYVLESYLFGVDMFPFQLVQTSSGVAESGVYGVMVKRGCGLDTYDDALVELLSQDIHWQTEREALDFIVSHKIQATRRVSMMEHIMRRAKARRKEREALEE